MDDVQCTGNETSIFDCPHQTIDNCGGSEGLGVICSGDMTVLGELGPGQLGPGQLGPGQMGPGQLGPGNGALKAC